VSDASANLFLKRLNAPKVASHWRGVFYFMADLKSKTLKSRQQKKSEAEQILTTKIEKLQKDDTSRKNS